MRTASSVEGTEVPAWPPAGAATPIDGTRRDPVTFLAALREREPVAWIPGVDAWLVTRHEDVRRLFTEPRLTADPRAYAHHRRPRGPAAARWLTEMPFRAAPPPGGASPARRRIAAAFTPRAAAALAPKVRACVERFAAPLRGRRGVVDLIEAYTAPASALALGRVLGVPPREADELHFREIGARATRAIRPILSPGGRRAAEAAGVEIAEYVAALVERRRTHPADDLISSLLRAARDDGPEATEEIVRLVAALVSAGVGTTAVAAARALRALFGHPDQLALLRCERALLPDAVSELLRYDSGLIVVPRYVREGFRYQGRDFAAGQLVALSPLGANRDPRVFPDPDRLDLRRDTRAALAFGHAGHFCPGASLARIELAALIDAALDFLPADAHLLEDEIRWSARGVMSQIQTLPVDFDPAPARARTRSLRESSDTSE